MDSYARQIESDAKRITSHEERIASDAKLIATLRARLMKLERDQQPLDQSLADKKDFVQHEVEHPMAAASQY